METLNYKELGLKAGLEVHFQLDTKEKLFCHCLTNLIERKPDFTIKRFLRPVLSEILEKDIVAEFEESKNRYSIYEAYNNETCLVELDECPPYELNEEALEVALQVAKLLNAKVVDEIQVMRKQVLDYSNTSGFQRSSLIAYNGYIEIKHGRVGIASISLEEDAARKMQEGKEHVVYRLDRLGIPLIEIATHADIKNPEQAREVAAYLGMVLNSTGKIKNILGSIRQDVNVSIAKGARTEIKGVQELRLIPLVIKNEISRQLNLVKQNKKVENEVRAANDDGSTRFLRPLPGASRMYVETDVPSFETNMLIKDIKLPKLIIEQVKDLQSKYDLSLELSNELVKQDVNFQDYIKKYGKINSGLLASVIINNIDENKEHMEFVLSALNSGKITKDVVSDIFSKLKDGKKIDLSTYSLVNMNSIENEVKKIVNENSELSVNAIMGMLMKKYKGRVEGKKLIELINKFSTK